MKTRTGNFIDILLLSDSHAILIENKIYAGIDNPLDDYAAYLHEYQKKYPYKFLLTLRPVCVPDGFQNITHAQFVKEIRRLLGCYVAGADTHYLIFMLDFLNTLDYLQGGIVMNPEFVEFLNNRTQDVEKFLKELKTFRGELRDKVNRLSSLIRVDSGSDVSQWKYRESFGLFDILVHDIALPRGVVIAIDTVVSPAGWTIEIFHRKNPQGHKLQILLQNLGVREKKRGAATSFRVTSNTLQNWT